MRLAHPGCPTATTPMKLKIESNLQGVVSRFQQIDGVIANSQTMRDGYKQAGTIYLSYIRRRFLSAARGDGTWPDLADSTKLKRRRGRTGRVAKTSRKKDRSGKPVRKGKRKRQKVVRAAVVAGTFEILRDTGLLFNSLTQGSSGNVFRDLPDGVAVGTNIKYAEHHQSPKVPGRPPKREILVQPDDATKQRIKQALRAAVTKSVQQLVRRK